MSLFSSGSTLKRKMSKVIIPTAANKLLAQIKAAFKRDKAIDSVPVISSFISGEIKINFDTRCVMVGLKELRLTPTEYNLLRELVLNVGKVCAYNHLLNRIWGSEYEDEKTYIHTYIRRLRAKLEPNPGNSQYIISVPGVGYWFRKIL